MKVSYIDNQHCRTIMLLGCDLIIFTGDSGPKWELPGLLLLKQVYLLV